MGSKPVVIVNTLYGARLSEVLRGRVSVLRRKDNESKWGGEHRCYDVLIDGQLIGCVDGSRQTTSKIYKNSRIRYDLGQPMQWTGDLFAGFCGSVTGYGCDSRADAAICVAQAWLEHQGAIAPSSQKGQ